MGPLSYMSSVVDQNVGMRRTTVNLAAGSIQPPVLAHSPDRLCIPFHETDSCDTVSSSPSALPQIQSS